MMELISSSTKHYKLKTKHLLIPRFAQHQTNMTISLSLWSFRTNHNHSSFSHCKNKQKKKEFALFQQAPTATWFCVSPFPVLLAASLWYMAAMFASFLCSWLPAPGMLLEWMAPEEMVDGVTKAVLVTGLARVPTLVFGEDSGVGRAYDRSLWWLEIGLRVPGSVVWCGMPGGVIIRWELMMLFPVVEQWVLSKLLFASELSVLIDSFKSESTKFNILRPNY